MQRSVFKPRRRKGGKLDISRLSRGRYKLEWMLKAQEIALKTPDKQVAERLLDKVVAKSEKEHRVISHPMRLAEGHRGRSVIIYLIW